MVKGLIILQHYQQLDYQQFTCINYCKSVIYINSVKYRKLLLTVATFRSHYIHLLSNRNEKILFNSIHTHFFILAYYLVISIR
jgi:hypothetical protein